MNRPIKTTQTSQEAGQTAEHRLAADENTGLILPNNDKRLIQALQLHQIELEMQVEALKTEADLLESYAFVTSVLNALPLQIAVLDRQGVIVAVNNAWVQFGKDNGLPVACHYLLGANYLAGCKNNQNEFIDEQAEAVYQGIQSVLAGVQPLFSLEYACSSPDQQRWFCMTVAPLGGSRGGVVLSHENITPRKLSERMPNLLKAMFDISLDGFLEFDAAGNLLNVNEAYAKLIGYTVDELCQMNISQLDVHHGLAEVQARIQQVRENAYDKFETAHRHKNGDIIDMEIAVAYLPDYQRYCAFCHDITQRKLTEGKLNAIFSASVDGFIVYDHNKRIVSANPAVESIFGYTLEELLGCNINTLMPTLPDCLLDCRISKTKDRNPADQTFEIEGVHHDGSLLPLELSRAQYAINDDCYKINIVRNISVRKQQEKLDKAHLDELAHVTRLGLMGEMASGIAHEVNQPLTAISNYVQASINLINTDRYVRDELTEILYKTQQQALRAGQIIHHMRDFLKSRPRNITTIDIKALIYNAVSLCIDDIRQHNINLSFEFSAELPYVLGDHIQIEQVIINLIRNSIDVLKNQPENQRRDLSIHTQQTPAQEIQIRIKDNGPGIQEDQQAKIFTPFYSSKETGMGLGLSICRSLVEAHKGLLRFNSIPGKGTTFYFTLPIHE